MPRPHCVGEIWKRSFQSKNASNIFHPQYAGEVWKRSFHPENASMFSVHTMPEKFGNRVFTLKPYQVFSIHTTPEKSENTAITGHFVFVFEKNLRREMTWLSWRHRFWKAPFSKCFRSHWSAKPVFQIAPVWRAFSKSFVFVTDKCGRLA